MEVVIKKHEDETIIAIEGRLDTVSAMKFSSGFIEQIMEPSMKKLILDCEKLSFISSAGLRVFLVLSKVAKSKNVDMIIRKVDDTIKDIFDMTGFSDIFTLEK